MIPRPRQIKSSLKSVLRTRQWWHSGPGAMRFFLAAQMDPAARLPACGFSLDGMQFRVRPTDYYAFQEIIVEGEYDFIKPILASAGPSPMVADIGANIGLFAVRALAYSSGARVHSLEPVADTFGALDANRRLNASRKWETHKVAAWSANGEVEFQTGDFSTGARVSAKAGGEKVPTVDLPTVLRDILRTSEVDLMKVDVEGAEEAFLSGRQELLQGVRNLIIEVHPGRCDHEKLLRELRAAFPYGHEVPGRASAKPLLLFSRSFQAFPKAVA